MASGLEAEIEKIDEPEKSIEEVVEKVVEPVIEENIIHEPEITSPSIEPETAPRAWLSTAPSATLHPTPCQREAMDTKMSL